MFQNILVPVDLTDRHQRALEIAANLARQNGGQVTLLHVIELIQGLPMEEEKTFYQRLERKARAYLDRLCRTLEEQKVPFDVEILFGDRAQEIIRHATQSGTNLIVLTSRRIDMDHPGPGWGALSFKLSLLSQCPILLVK
jgi:universal stress protein A